MGSIEHIVIPPPKGKLRKGIRLHIKAMTVAIANIIAVRTSLLVVSFFILSSLPIFRLKNNTALGVRCFILQIRFLHALRSLRICFHLPTPVLPVSGYRVRSLCSISADLPVSTPVRSIQLLVTGRLYHPSSLLSIAF